MHPTMSSSSKQTIRMPRIAVFALLSLLSLLAGATPLDVVDPDLPVAPIDPALPSTTSTATDITTATTTSDDESGHIDPAEMPPVAPMIPTGCSSVMDFLAADPRFSIFRTAVEETGLDSVFGNIRLLATVLLPTNEGIARTFQERADIIAPERLLKEYVSLERLVRNHVLPMYNIDYDNLKAWGGCYDTMVEGTCVRVSLGDDDEVRLGSDASVGVVQRDMSKDYCPTTIHAVDGLLLVDGDDIFD